jgi:hypothetical protein
VPEWLGRNNTRSNAPAGGADVPTAPVPATGEQWGSGGQQRPQPAGFDDDPDSDTGRRNIFRIFTN